jgi:anti-sigma-K factor RskA
MTDDEREELEEMIGVYALDATDDVERARIERYLADHPEARRELARYEDALAALVTDEIAAEPPPGAWSGIAERVAAAPRPATAKRPHRARAWLAVAAAVLVIALAGTFAAVRIGGGPSRASQMAAAQRDPAAGTGSLAGSAGEAPVALRPDGRGYLDVDALAPLPSGKVYQLWSLDGPKPVSLGVLDTNSGVATFTTAPDTRSLALTVEAAPGAAQPTSAPVAQTVLT